MGQDACHAKRVKMFFDLGLQKTCRLGQDTCIANLATSLFALLLSSMSFIAHCQVVSSMTILPILPISQSANHVVLARSSHSYAQR